VGEVGEEALALQASGEAAEEPEVIHQNTWF